MWRLYPNDSNAYDSLGEAFMNAGRKDDAITNYKKSLELNPKNDNAVKMLERASGKLDAGRKSSEIEARMAPAEITTLLFRLGRHAGGLGDVFIPDLPGARTLRGGIHVGAVRGALHAWTGTACTKPSAWKRRAGLSLTRRGRELSVRGVRASAGAHKRC